MIIREGKKEDLPEALRLVRELADFVNAPQAVSVTLADMERDGFGEHPLYAFFVAEDETKQTIGLALYYYRYSSWKGKYMYLEDIIVLKEFRGRGAGRKLFDAVIKKGIETDCTGMMWQVLEWNKQAIDFYVQKYHAKIDEEYYNCTLRREQMISRINT